MKPKLSLKTEAGDILFHLKQVKENYFHFTIQCNMNCKFSFFNINDIECCLDINDLVRLDTYLKTHILKLEKSTSIEKYNTYTPMYPYFQLTCQDGYIDGTEGDFSLCFLLNLGEVTENGVNNYFGFESITLIKDIMDLCDNINAIMEASNE